MSWRPLSRAAANLSWPAGSPWRAAAWFSSPLVIGAIRLDPSVMAGAVAAVLAGIDRVRVDATLHVRRLKAGIAQFESGVTSESTSHGFLPPIHCKSVPGIISSYPCL